MKTLHILRTLLLPVLLATLLAGLGTALAQEDDESMAAAREALSRARYRQAAELYEQARARTNVRSRVAEALYWEAFSRYRLDRTRELKRALELLEMQAQYEADADANLVAESEALAMRIAGELAERGEESAAREIYQKIAREQQREETRVAALHALMQMNPEKARPILEKIVRGETRSSLEMRRNAVFMLCNEDERGVTVILEMLPRTEDPEMVEVMVMCLAQSDSPKAVDAMVELMRTTEDQEVAQAVLMSLGQHEDPRVFGILAEIAQDRDRDPELRAHALWGLAQIEDERAPGIAAAIIRTKGEKEEVLETALMVLAQHDSSAAGQALLEMARDPSLDEEFRAQALYMAGQEGHVEAAPPEGDLRHHREPRDEGTDLPRADPARRPRAGLRGLLLEIVRHEDDPEIRRDAVFWMGQFDDPRAADFLLEIIEGN